MNSVRSWWYALVGSLAAVAVVTSWGSLGGRTWEQPGLLFAVQTIAAASCLSAATVLIALADRRDMAELGLLGTMLMAPSVLTLVHGLLTPDVLFGESEAFRTSAFLALPAAIVVGTPLLRPHSSFGRWAARRWRDWSLLSLLGLFVLAAVLVSLPDALVIPAAGSPLMVAVTVAIGASVLVFSRRQLHLFELGRQTANLVASFALLLVASIAVLPIVPESYSFGFWWLHVAGTFGVLGVCVGLVASKRLSESARDLLAPVLSRDPLVAFELGLSPVVHRFVADLESKDQLTRDHTVRTGELALRVGERFQLTARELRELGIAALLHDIGKLHTPDEILAKPGSLTAEEYEIVKRHPVDGEQMLRAEPSLAGAARIVRHHHERVDGTGYPDGLAGPDIPIGSRIIAACDAVDAMTHDRHFRAAMSYKMAFAVLREQAGSQWDPAVVEQVISVYPTLPVVSSFDEVGRADAAVAIAADVAAYLGTDDAETELPADVDRLLATVDAEI